MKYAILFYEDAAGFANRTGEQQAEYWGAWTAYMRSMSEAGVMRPGGSALQLPGTATTVRVNGSGKTVQDGPYADTKEQLGGFVMIEAANLDAALDWAARSPAAAVEVRPLLEMTA